MWNPLRLNVGWIFSLATVCLVVALGPGLLSAQPFGLAISGGEGSVEDTVTAEVMIEVEEGGFSGLQFAVCHDPDLVSIDSSDLALGSLLDGEALGFEGVEVHDDSWNAVVVVDLLDPAETIDTGGALYEGTYTLDHIGTCRLSICDGALPTPGEGESAVVLVDGDGESVEPSTKDAAIQVLGDWAFRIENQTNTFDPTDGSGDDVVARMTIAQLGGDDDANSGFQGGLSHDDTFLELVSVDATGALSEVNDGAGPAYLATNLDPENGAGFTFVVLYSLLDPLESIDYGTEEAVLEITYSLVSDAFTDADGPIETALSWDAQISSVAVIPAIVVDGDEETPNTYDGELTFTTGVNFKRGDADGNGTIFAIIDALFILEYGFTNGPEPPCLDAADADGNNTVFPIIDALYVLEYGFTNGPPPPDPGPSECGPDPDDDSVSCETPPSECS